MKWFLLVMGGFGIASYIQFVEAMSPVKTVPAAVFNGLVLVAMALFVGLCFVALAVIDAADRVTAARRSGEETRSSPATYRPGIYGRRAAKSPKREDGYSHPLAFCWAYVSGAWLYQQKPWKVKKHGRLMVSLFRAGLDWLQSLLMPLCGRKQENPFDRAVRFLPCTEGSESTRWRRRSW